MVNTCEPLLNVVNNNKPKRLCRRKTARLEPKGKWPGSGALTSPLTDRRATGEQAEPKPFGSVRETW